MKEKYPLQGPPPSPKRSTTSNRNRRGVSRLIFGEAPKDLMFLCFGNVNHQPMVVSCFYAGDVVSLPESPIKGIGSWRLKWLRRYFPKNRHKVVDNSFVHFGNQAIIQQMISPKSVFIHFTSSAKKNCVTLHEILVVTNKDPDNSLLKNPCNGGELYSQNHWTSKTDRAILNLINVAVALLPYFWPTYNSTEQLLSIEGCQYWGGGGVQKMLTLSWPPSTWQ